METPMMDKSVSLRQVLRFFLAFAGTMLIAWLGDFNPAHAAAVVLCFYWEQLAFRLIIPEKPSFNKQLLVEEPKPRFTRSGRLGSSALRVMK
jgi:hypothetical protein